MKAKTMKYEEAMLQLENIVQSVEEGNLDIDLLCEKLKQAQLLLKFCKDRLTKTQEEMEKILGDNDQEE